MPIKKNESLYAPHSLYEPCPMESSDTAMDNAGPAVALKTPSYIYHNVPLISLCLDLDWATIHNFSRVPSFELHLNAHHVTHPVMLTVTWME